MPEIACPEGAHTLDGANRSGAYKIAWKGADGAVFRLVEAPSGASVKEGQVLYEGPERASTVTGRPEGDYHYAVARIGEGAPVWSASCEVKVRPYPLELAFTFFGFGLVVTVATVVLIVRGHRAHKRGAIG